MTIKEFIMKFNNQERFERDELRDLFYGDVEEDDDDEGYEVDCIEHRNRRWSRIEEKILKINGRYFSVSGDIGLTEHCDNEFDIQPVEVEPREKVITITEWVKKNDTN